jgi:hypothetical protein
VLVRFDHIASVIINPEHSIMGTALPEAGATQERTLEAVKVPRFVS